MIQSYNAVVAAKKQALEEKECDPGRLRWEGSATSEQLYLRFPISQASPVPDNIVWRTLNRRGTRDGTQKFPGPYLTGHIKIERVRWICWLPAFQVPQSQSGLRSGAPMVCDIRNASVYPATSGYGQAGYLHLDLRRPCHDVKPASSAPRCAAA